jgi:predicted small secreted protein
MEEAMSLKIAGRLALILLFGSMLAACSDTWSGMKEDTGENMEAVGDKVSETGEAVKEDAEEAK